MVEKYLHRFEPLNIFLFYIIFDLLYKLFKMTLAFYYHLMFSLKCI